ncbi:DUF4439 domain-containing protein [Arthrobacter pascens]|uniref:DUF4439 domain-containing protein n=1 Tax=Arthrobacter pascens TaxID=1677 RepID=UPI0027D8199D|nr:DUF4439 domain-containing protein [Arthrobacter pascens]
MNDASQESNPGGRYFRYAVFSLTALLVLSLGIALIPHEPAPPAAPPFSEQARAAAFADAMSLRAAGLDLATAASGTGTAASTDPLDRVVTLLTIQARALMSPDDSAAPGTQTGPTAGPPDGPIAASAAPSVSSVAELAAALSASGAKRLGDAETADGGIARLLAGTGAAQLLAAEDIAVAAGVPAEATPTAAEAGEAAEAGKAEGSAVPEESTGPAAGCSTTEPASGGASLASALTAAVEAEQEAVYGYQAALTRLDSASAAPASDLLEQHQDLAGEVLIQSRIHCASVPPQQPGYTLSDTFLDAPAAGLGRLEAGTLPVYGDVVALSEGSTRSWAISALVAAARRTLHWGADPGAVPGVPVDESRLPQLPE